MGTTKETTQAEGASSAAIDTTTAGFVTVPRCALQALAEWAYPLFTWDRIRAKLPTPHPRWTSHNINDDMCEALEQERIHFLKNLFWKAEQEAARRERALDPTRGLGYHPSLEMFMCCVAEMDDHHWDEPLSPKAVKELKKKLRAENVEKEAAWERMDKWEQEQKHPTPESVSKTMAHFGDIALFYIGENLASDNPEIQAKAQEEVSRLLAGLQKLQAPTGKDQVEVAG